MSARESLLKSTRADSLGSRRKAKGMNVTKRVVKLALGVLFVVAKK